MNVIVGCSVSRPSTAVSVTPEPEVAAVVEALGDQV
jgi:hypothetical protein